MEFPRWMYRQDVEKGRLFSTAKELQDAGEGWLDSPAFLHSVPDATGSTEEPQFVEMSVISDPTNFDPVVPIKPRRGRPRKVTDANLHTA